MRAFVTSDLHWDDWASECKTAENYIHGWRTKSNESHCGLLPETEAIIIAGDIANTYDAWCEMIVALAHSYEEVIVVLGNHDICCDWADKSRFSDSTDKISAMSRFVKYYPNVHLLDGNVVRIGDTLVGGCMGMWDYTFAAESSVWSRLVDKRKKLKSVVLDMWKTWFDYRHWNYLGNDVERIAGIEFAKMEHCLAQHPDVMVTHYCPYPGLANIPKEYRSSVTSTYFYFDVAKADNVRLWVAGHTHDVHSHVGPKHNVLVNPVGYFEELTHTGHRDYADFTIDL